MNKWAPLSPMWRIMRRARPKIPKKPHGKQALATKMFTPVWTESMPRQRSGASDGSSEHAKEEVMRRSAKSPQWSAQFQIKLTYSHWMPPLKPPAQVSRRGLLWSPMKWDNSPVAQTINRRNSEHDFIIATTGRSAAKAMDANRALAETVWVNRQKRKWFIAYRSPHQTCGDMATHIATAAEEQSGRWRHEQKRVPLGLITQRSKFLNRQPISPKKVKVWRSYHWI